MFYVELVVIESEMLFGDVYDDECGVGDEDELDDVEVDGVGVDDEDDVVGGDGGVFDGVGVDGEGFDEGELVVVE